MHATIPKGNMRYDQYSVPDTVAVENTFLASPLVLQTYVLYMASSLKNSELRTTPKYLSILLRALFPTGNSNSEGKRTTVRVSGEFELPG